jgi:hypothetical protein
LSQPERNMHENEPDREARLRELASRLFFTLKNHGARFVLYRDTDVSRPVRHECLTLDEVEDRPRWKCCSATSNAWTKGQTGGKFDVCLTTNGTLEPTGSCFVFLQSVCGSRKPGSQRRSTRWRSPV